MLTAFRLGNFKAFAETQRIPLRPITLIFGANSSGKSSLIHGLLFTRNAIETGELDVYRTEIGGEAVDLGGFRQYVHRRNSARRVVWGLEVDTKKFEGRLAELLRPLKDLLISGTFGVALDDNGNPIRGAIPVVDSFEIEGDGSSILRMSRRADSQLRLDRLRQEHAVVRAVINAIVESGTTAAKLDASDIANMSEAVTELVPQMAASGSRLIPDGILKSESTLPHSEGMLLFPVSRGQRKEDLSRAIAFFLPRVLDELVQGLSAAVAKAFKRLRYLGPLRSYPPRHLAFSQYHDPNWYAGGGYAWDVVRRDAIIRAKVNGWLGDPAKLGTHYELAIRNLLTIDDLDADYAAFIEDLEKRFTEVEKYDFDLFGEIYGALDSLKSSEDRISSIQELVLVDKRTSTFVSHRDVGIGISQVLPVLVAAYASQGNILAMEQPEIHLHPALQAELADVFIHSALAEQANTFILETHSEHLILRILRRIRETTDGELSPGLRPIRPEDVAVLYVSPGKEGCRVVEIPINPDGEFAEAWPDGFFPERAKELF